MANVGFLVPRPRACPECKGGTKGMDVCEKCAGSGTVFLVNGRYYPDTREGYDQAERALNNSLMPQVTDDPEAWLRDTLAYRLADYL